MRGSGKSKMGKALADHLGWKFIDLDDLFVEVVGEPIKTFVAKHDWPAFRAKEEQLLRKTVDNNRARTIISTGKKFEEFAYHPIPSHSLLTALKEEGWWRQRVLESSCSGCIPQCL